MNSTTGAEATALSIAVRVSVDRKDFWRAAKRGERRGFLRGRSTWLASWTLCKYICGVRRKVIVLLMLLILITFCAFVVVLVSAQLKLL